MAILFTNNASSTLSQTITDDATTILIQMEDQGEFPSPAAATDYFMLTLEDPKQNPPAREIVKCTARTGNSLTVARAQEGSTAQGFSAGVIAEVRITAGVLNTILQGISLPTTLYLGAFSSAPSAGVGGAVLIVGNLYYNTTQKQLFEYNGNAWVSLTANTSSTQFGVYLGAFSSAPITMLNGTALVDGTLYYDTTQNTLFEWDGSAWVNASAATTNTTPSPNTTGGDGVFNNITVKDQTSTGTLLLAGALVVDAGDVSGTANTQNFPAGTLFQCGSANTDGSGNAIVSFPKSFVGVPVSVVATPFGPTSAAPNIVVTFSWSPSGFSAITANSVAIEGPVAFAWMAFGPGGTT